MNPLTQAKEILSSNKTEKAAKDLMTNEQRKAIADDYAASNQFQSAAHFEPDKEKAKEYETLFWSRFENRP